ncbi:MAG: radical SAM protein [Myxococcota bacterium]
MLSPAFDVQRFSIHDGPGVRTTVFLRGCPLRCAWCHNPEGLQPCAEPESEAWLDEVLAQVGADRPFYDVSGGGLTLSGGEPLLVVSRARRLLAAAKALGLRTCVQTCGAVPLRHLEEVAPLVDLFQFDLKHLDDAEHRRWTGAGLERIHSSARWLVAHGATVEFRMPVVPGVNDDEQNLLATARFLRELGVSALTLVPWHGLARAKDEALARPSFQTTPPTPAQLERVETTLRSAGVIARR